ncbi:MAG TPA: hypothetical protein VD768_08895 [Sphingomicrobium sp.]|nr:hypothetical protein [Sphingomicrobium sp.]
MTEPPLVARARALRETQARFRGRRFDWRSDDCIRMARFHLIANGHRPPRLPPYRSALGAKKALRAQGAESVIALLDGILPRIAPAEMLPGDVAALKGTEGLDALMICVGAKLLGWHESADEPVIVIPHRIEAAWRVDPRGASR